MKKKVKQPVQLKQPAQKYCEVLCGTAELVIVSVKFLVKHSKVKVF